MFFKCNIARAVGIAVDYLRRDLILIDEHF